MKIFNDYKGSSIKIDSIDNSTNTAYLSLVSENGKASHYYNFIAENEFDTSGSIIINSLNQSSYYSDNPFAPYQKEHGIWSKMSKGDYTLDGNNIVFSISKHTTKEISLTPRYTQDDLINFCKKNSLDYTDSVLLKIELGNVEKPTIFVIGRQHPGETLSSFFIEGIIKEILNNSTLQENYHFLFYPIVNKIGVEKGCHRYLDGVDFNRSWVVSSPPSEISYIKSELEKCKNLQFFIDIHNDELTPKDYIRLKNSSQKEIGNIQVLEPMSTIRRFIRALIKQRKIIDLNKKTAREYVENKYSCQSILLELSMNDDFNLLFDNGKIFIKDICK